MLAFENVTILAHHLYTQGSEHNRRTPPATVVLLTPPSTLIMFSCTDFETHMFKENTVADAFNRGSCPFAPFTMAAAYCRTRVDSTFFFDVRTK